MRQTRRASKNSLLQYGIALNRAPVHIHLQITRAEYTEYIHSNMNVLTALTTIVDWSTASHSSRCGLQMDGLESNWYRELPSKYEVKTQADPRIPRFASFSAR